MFYAHYEAKKYCPVCRERTTHYRHHGPARWSWKLFYRWPGLMSLAIEDPWRCRACAHFKWW